MNEFGFWMNNVGACALFFPGSPSLLPANIGHMGPHWHGESFPMPCGSQTLNGFLCANN